MEQTIEERVLLVVQELYHGKVTEMARAIGMAPPTLISQTNGQRTLSLSTIMSIAKASEVSAEWLLTGRGTMKDGLKAGITTEETDTSQSVPQQTIPSGSQPVNATVQQLISLTNKALETCNKTVDANNKMLEHITSLANKANDMSSRLIDIVTSFQAAKSTSHTPEQPSLFNSGIGNE